mgnify:CR=1 FL=1
MKHYNQLTPAEDERLALLLEEMGEAQQVIGKILRHGYENYHPDDPKRTSNRVLLAQELGHVFAATQMLAVPEDIDEIVLEWSRQEKLEKGKKWMRHQG